MLYTDGLIEGFSGPDRQDRLWNTGLLKLLAEQRDDDLEGLSDRLVSRAEELNGGPLSDDVATLLLTAAELRR
jgi:serine phosphatase RsbU (regulator of sigma subunit)